MNKTFILIFYGFQKEMMTQKIKEKCHEIKVFWNSDVSPDRI